MRKVLLMGGLLATTLHLSGCTALPEMKFLKADLSAAWPTDQTDKKPSEIPLSHWWEAYNAPVLNALIAEALTNNRDLKLAAARIEESRANYGLSDADRYPEIALAAEAGRNKITGKGSSPMPAGTPLTNNHFKINLQAAWEVDLWGRYRAANEAARAELLASEFARHAIQSSLTEAVAQAYFSLAALDANIALTENTLANRKKAVELHRLRSDIGLAPELPLFQARAEQASVEVTLSQLRRQARQQELALAVLLGREPRALLEGAIARGAALETLIQPPAIPAGLPSDLLKRRPDLLQAEQKLFNAQARIREAGAARYPNLALTANLGSESKALSDLLSAPATLWGLAAGVSQTLFNAGRTEAALQARGARQEQALLEYEQALQVAFKEVLAALVAHREARETANAETNRIDALRSATQIAEQLFQNGASGHLELLDTQRNLLQAEQGLIEARRAQLSASASLFKALGGGWNGPTTAP